MKKFFTMALISLAFIACNKEENKPETPKEEVVSIEGTWHPEAEAIPVDDCYKKSTYTYSDGKYKWVIYEEDNNGDCKLARESSGIYLIPKDNRILIEERGGFTFSINGNTLTMTSDKGNVTIFKKQ